MKVLLLLSTGELGPWLCRNACKYSRSQRDAVILTNLTKGPNCFQLGRRKKPGFMPWGLSAVSMGNVFTL